MAGDVEITGGLHEPLPNWPPSAVGAMTLWVPGAVSIGALPKIYNSNTHGTTKVSQYPYGCVFTKCINLDENCRFSPTHLARS